MIIIRNLSLDLGSKPIFNDITVTFNQQEKIGLVGRNGAGKSTFLKVLSGNLSADQGSIVIEKSKKVGYLPQEVVLVSSRVVLDEALTVFHETANLRRIISEIEHIMTQHEHHNSELLDRYSLAQQQLAESDWQFQLTEARKILSGLGFSASQLTQRVDELSLGWRMRLVLAQLLLQKADFYLFDEPTNHLDIVAKEWFIDFLRSASFGFLLVSHDKFFLDAACQKIFELERGNGKFYNGNYSLYMKQKEDEKVALKAAYEAQQREIKQKMDTINRFRASASKAKMAQSMLKSLEKMERLELPPDSRSINLVTDQVKRSGKVVLTVKDLSKHFGDKKIFDHVSFEVFREEKVALVAANGQGKSTLLNLITQHYPLEKGSVEFGHQVEYAFFEQDQASVLNPEKTILQEVEDACSTSQARQSVRSLLGAFLFPGEDVYKKTKVLSGGEKNRVAMVKVLLKGANFLILDEPTNHLDIESKEILLKALQQFTGTILFISHDRDFLDRLATNILELTPQGVIAYAGNYESYLYQKQQQISHSQPSMPEKGKGTQALDKNAHNERKVAPKVSNKELYELTKVIIKLERKIEKLEQEIASLHARYAEVSYGTSAFIEHDRCFKDKQKQLEHAYQEWEQLELLRSQSNS